MKKKLLAMSLVSAMALTLLAGCGEEETKQSEASNAVSVTNESKEESVEKEETKESEEPEEPVTVTWRVYGNMQTGHDMVMEDLNKKIREKINVELNLECINAGEYGDKMKLASTSGDTYEIAWTSNWLNEFDANMARGAFMPLDDLLEEYGQGILENCPEWLREVGKVNGVQYAIPCLQITAEQSSVYMLKSYADEYGWDKTNINSIEELYPFLDWVEEKYPDLTALYVDAGLAMDYPKQYEKLNDFLWCVVCY